MKLLRFLTALGFLLGLLSCSDKSYHLQGDEVLVRVESQEESSSAGNLIASAMKYVHNLDVVIYPRALLSPDKYSVVRLDLDSFEMEELLKTYPSGVPDQFMLGSMLGKNLKKFILQRTQETYGVEVEVAGIKYDISFVGGIPQYSHFTKERGLELKDDENYRIAINKAFFFSGPTFPGYKYRNSFNFIFKEQGKTISARESLESFLKSGKELPYLKEIRARVRRVERGNAGRQTISTIQGSQHRSPLYGKKVTTRGIITAVGSAQWYPGGVDIYIQSLDPDKDSSTSEGLHVYLDHEDHRFYLKAKACGEVQFKNPEEKAFQLGDVIEVSGTVYEQMTSTGLGKTSIREVTYANICERGRKLPPPIYLKREQGIDAKFSALAEFPVRKGEERVIPSKHISTFRGNLNMKPYLKLSDGIDFWESLEGMRVQIDNPLIVGFRGGQEDFENLKPKTYLNLYVLPDGNLLHRNKTTQGGVSINEPKRDYNPEIMQIITNHLTYPFNTEKAFNVGDMIPGPIQGVLAYEKNLFGDGEYALVLPRSSEKVDAFLKTASEFTRPQIERPRSTLKPEGNRLLVASMNVENLAGYQDRRLAKLAETIEVNLFCPDIMNLVEIQDEDGQDFTPENSGNDTLKNLIGYIHCENAEYHSINIDPISNAEGGEPGGNIRVAMIYNAKRVSFERRGNAGFEDENIIGKDGKLRDNPGRIFPNDEAFKGSRRSLAAEFEFRGERIVLIGNHLNSKLGDRSLWAAVQPPVFDSEKRRIRMANKVNDFVELLALKAPKSHVLVAGDFNAFYTEDSIRVLEGRHLQNLITFDNRIPQKDRYTTNHNGNSQALDYIFASKGLLRKNPEVEVLHINSDFMGRISDHDPVVARFSF